MKRIIESVKSNSQQMLEILLLIVVAALPFVVDLPHLFEEYLGKNPLSPENFMLYTAVSKGKYIASFILILIVLFGIRKYNAGLIMNRMRVYHDYSYSWYWFCAKVLGIKKCSLILVPIQMQFKLAIRGTFEEYPLNDDDYPAVAEEPECSVTKDNIDQSNSEINIILEDTYVIEVDKIPKSKRDLYTIWISRNDGKSNGRHFSQKFIETSINVVRSFKNISTVNVFATTNPKNTLHIANRVFGLGERGNIKHLYVFQQKREDKNRVFESRGHRIY